MFSLSLVSHLICIYTCYPPSSPPSTVDTAVVFQSYFDFVMFCIYVHFFRFFHYISPSLCCSALRFYFGCNTLMRKAFSVSTYLHTNIYRKATATEMKAIENGNERKNWSSNGKSCCCCCDGNTMKKMAFTKRGRYLMEISECMCSVRSILSISFCDCFAVFFFFFYSFPFALVFMVAIMLKNEQYEMWHTRNKTSSLA